MFISITSLKFLKFNVFAMAEPVLSHFDLYSLKDDTFEILEIDEYMYK